MPSMMFMLHEAREALVYSMKRVEAMRADVKDFIFSEVFVLVLLIDYRFLRSAAIYTPGFLLNFK